MDDPIGGLEIFERVEDLPPIWDRVARGGGLSLCRRFLHAVHESVQASRTMRYLMYRTASGAAMIAVAELLQRPVDRNWVMSTLLGRLSDRVPSALNWLLPMLVLRPELSNDAPFCTLASTPAEREPLLRGMLAALLEEASRQGWSLAVAHISHDDPTMTRALLEQGYLRTLTRPSAALRIEWDSWEGYLRFAARRSKNAAANIRYEVNRARREGLAIVPWNPAEVPEATLNQLLDEHDRRLNGPGQPPRGLIGNLSQGLGDDVRILLAVREARVQGMVAFALAGTRAYAIYLGLLPRAQRDGFAYFNLAYYHPIRLAIELGLESIAYGNAALAAKIRRGCTAATTALFVRPRHGLLRSALRGPMELHRRALERKYAPIVEAGPFSNLRSRGTRAPPVRDPAAATTTRLGGASSRR